MLNPVKNWLSQLGGGTSALDTKLEAVIRDVMASGASLANTGDRAGCRRLFEGALLVLRAMLDHQAALQGTIDRGTAFANQQATDELRAARLRDVLETVRTALVPATQQAPPPAPGGGGKPAPPPASPAPFAVSAEEYEVVVLTNKERAVQRLPALKPAPKLFPPARAHAANMARQGKLDHVLDGKDVADRLRDTGYTFTVCAENVACGQRTPTDVVAGWMTSPGHRANILLAQATEIGIAVANDPSGVRYWVQVFGTPK